MLYLIDLSEGVFDFVVESVRNFLDFSGGDRVAVMHEMGVGSEIEPVVVQDK